jgi:PKD repeat protein
MIVPKYFYRVLNILLFIILFIGSIHAQADFYASQTEGCTPFKVKFSPDFTAVDPDTIISVKWYFGFGDTITSRNPDTVIYNKADVYTVVMVINNHKSNAIVKTDLITVHKTVQAAFVSDEFAVDYNYIFIPVDSITDTFATYNYTWTYTSNTSTIVHNRVVNYLNPSSAIDTFSLDTGVYHVILKIEDSYGCVSQFEKIFSFSDPIIIPNVFVPPVHHFFQIDPMDFNTVLLFKVFNRNGLLVFEQEAPIISWNGQTNSGKDLNTGVYYYVLEAVEGDSSKRYTKNGFIHLYR